MSARGAGVAGRVGDGEACRERWRGEAGGAGELVGRAAATVEGEDQGRVRDAFGDGDEVVAAFGIRRG